MAKKLSKKQEKYLTYGGGAVFIALLLLFLWWSNPASIVVTTTTTTVASGGGGGGGGSGDGNNNQGTTPPDGGFTCDNCDATFLEGNPAIVTNSYANPSPFMYVTPRAFLPQGHWNCNGTCIYNGADVSDDYNCVPDPTEQIPEGGYDSIVGDKPTCWCLKRNAGECAFYDSNYGQGLDDLKCGGSCPIGEVCSSWINGGKEICDCMKPEEQVECGFHFDNTLTTAGRTMDDYKEACYGFCAEQQNNDCKFWIDEQEQPRCDCLGYEETEMNDCESVDLTNGDIYKCWTEGKCPITGQECVYDQYTQKCACQNKGDCGWHITVEQAQQIMSEYGSFQEALKYIYQNIDDYCYGYCSQDTCGFQMVWYNGRWIYGCECFGAGDYPPIPPTSTSTTTTMPPFISGKTSTTLAKTGLFGGLLH